MKNWWIRLAGFLGIRTKSTNTPVRYVFSSLILSIAAILGAASLLPQNSSYIKLVPSQDLVKTGERFAIEVYANAHVPINAIDVSISFDPQTVEILSVDKAQSVLTVWTKEPEIANNQISFSGGTYRRGFIGEHVVATIKARAKSNGKADFSVATVQLLAGDGAGTPVPVNRVAEGGQVSFLIYDQDADPATIRADLTAKINADLDGDGQITLRDVSIFMSAWHGKSAVFDFNNDGRMTFIDFSIILAKSFVEFVR
mgnify:CR=1 FL=1